MKKLLTFVLFFASLNLFSQHFTDADRLIMEGAKLHDQQKYMEAVSKYQQALRINPNSISALYEMSLTSLKLEEYSNAIKYSTQVINLGFKPILLDAYVIKGTALANTGKVDEAIKLFLHASEELGSNYLLDYNLGLVYYNNNNKKKALAYVRRAIEQDPTHSDAFLLYASTLKDLGIWVQSIYAYQFFILQEPNTQRSAKAFEKMFDIIAKEMKSSNISIADEKLGLKPVYQSIDSLRTNLYDKNFRYDFFAKSSSVIFNKMDKILKQDPSRYKGLFWDFFVPIYAELLHSGHFDTYLRYVSACYFPESMKWWETNLDQVMSFKLWFEDGVEEEMDEEAMDTVIDGNEIDDSDIVEMDQQ